MSQAERSKKASNQRNRDLTQRSQAEEALRLRTRQLEAVYAISTEITRELDLLTLLGLIHQQAAQLVGATALIPQPGHGQKEWAEGVCIQLGEGVIGTVAQRREGMIVNTAVDAAALDPFAGSLAKLLFTVGILGAGFLAVPVPAASTGYVVSETAGWEDSLIDGDKQAKGFYAVITLALLGGTRGCVVSRP